MQLIALKCQSLISKSLYGATVMFVWVIELEIHYTFLGKTYYRQERCKDYHLPDCFITNPIVQVSSLFARCPQYIGKESVDWVLQFPSAPTCSACPSTRFWRDPPLLLFRIKLHLAFFWVPGVHVKAVKIRVRMYDMSKVTK